MRKLVFLAIALSTLMTAGCCKSNKESGESSGSSGSTGSKGLSDPGNDKAIVDLAKPVLECKWNAGFSSPCPADDAWRKSELPKDGKADATLVNFLDDQDEKVRYLGASMLAQKGKIFRKDSALATRVVNAADKETSKPVVSNLGRAVGGIDLKTTALVPRVKTMIAEHKNPDLREALASSTLFDNRDADGMYDLFVKLARTDKVSAVRNAAAAAFWTGTPSGKQEEVCKLWLELAADADGDLAGHSAYHCGFNPNAGCAGQWDALLSTLEKQSKAGTIKSSFSASALSYLHDQSKASAAQKKRCIEVAKDLVKNSKNNSSARGSALEFVGKKDPQGKAFAVQFENDSEFFVKNAAKRIKEGK